MEKLTYIKRENTDREGKQLVGKNGKPYVRVVIKVVSRGDRFISGFANVDNADWEIGDDIEVEIIESDKKDSKGLPYLNFRTPKKEAVEASVVNEKLEQLLNGQVAIRLALQSILGRLEGKKSDYPANAAPEPFPDDEIDINSVPF